MNKKVLVLFLGLLTIAMLATTVSSALATKSMPVSGSWVITPSVTDNKIAGNSDITITTSVNPITLTGGISGTGTYDRRFTNHGTFGTQGFFVTQHGVITIEATVDGKSGTLCIKTSANSLKSPDGEWTIISGTNDLENLHGQGTFSHVTPLLFTFEGQVHFDP